MKNINLFKFKDTSEFWAFLGAHGYKLEDVVGFSFAGKRQCKGNVLKLYNVRFNDGEYEYFKVIILKILMNINKRFWVLVATNY